MPNHIPNPSIDAVYWTYSFSCGTFIVSLFFCAGRYSCRCPFCNPSSCTIITHVFHGTQMPPQNLWVSTRKSSSFKSTTHTATHEASGSAHSIRLSCVSSAGDVAVDYVWSFQQVSRHASGHDYLASSG